MAKLIFVETTVDEQEFKDLLEQAIGDSFDIDWIPSDAMPYIIRALEEEGILWRPADG